MSENIINNFHNSILEYFIKDYVNLLNKKIIVYGASNYGKMIINALKTLFEEKCSIIGVSDSDENKWGSFFEGVEVKQISEFDKNDTIVVIGSQYYDEIKKALEDKGYNVFSKSDKLKFIEKMMNFYVYHTSPILVTNLEEQIMMYNSSFFDTEISLINLFADKESREIINNRVSFYRSGELKYLVDIELSDKKEYFDKDLYGKITSSEIYVDCGAYNGDSVLDFIDFVGGNYSLIYALEPDYVNFNDLTKNLNEKGIENVIAKNIGVGKESKKIGFINLGTMGSFVGTLESGNDSNLISIEALDHIIEDRVSLIKMDIEGEEYNALLGAENLIKKCKPKLAICLYHKCEHFFQIPLYLKSIVPEYTFSLKQHNYFEDVILYANVD